MTLNKFPDAEPSITLDFLKSKQLDPRITFSRASVGTHVVGGKVVEAPADVPRLSDKGLLIEEARTNRLVGSNNFTTARYAYTGIVINQDVTAPDGTNTAWSVKDTAVNERHNLTQFGVSGWIAPKNNVTTSLYVKPVSGTRKITIYNMVQGTAGGLGQIRFDPVAKTVQIDTGATTGGVIDAGNGWYRIWFTRNYASDTTAATRISFDSYAIYTGGSDEFHMWGLQHEWDGKYPTSYIPTSWPGSTVTRAADICSINQFDWINPTKCTWVTTAGTDTNPEFDWSRIINMAASGGGLLIDARGYQSYKAFGYKQRVTSDFARPGTKGAFAYAENNIRAAQDGVFAPLDTTKTGVDHGTITNLTLGSDSGINKFLNGYIERVSYYPTRVSDDALTSLTTSKDE